MLVAPLLVAFRDTCNEILHLGLIATSIASEDVNGLGKKYILPNFARPYLIGLIVAALIVIVQLLIMLAAIRRNLMQLFRGDDSEIPRRSIAKNILYINGNFRFAGALIGYVILSFIFLAILSMAIALGIETFILYGNIRIIERLLRVIIPTLLFTLFKIYLNKVLGLYVFLPNEGSVLTIDNHRVFTVFLYFNFFLDAFLGFFAAIVRLLKSFFAGIIYMCRLDYSPLGRKLESFDDGFNAYCGFIHMEATHRHPVLLCFMSHLLRAQLYGSSKKRWSRARHKWALALFLLNNPTLIYQRKRFLSRADANEMRVAFIGRKNMRNSGLNAPPMLTDRKTISSQIDLNEIELVEHF